MPRDDHSGYCCRFTFADIIAETATRAIIDWCTALAILKGLMADGSTHFRIESLRLVANGLCLPIPFNLPHTP